MASEPAGLATLCLDAGLTARQSQVIFKCADGLTYEEIAAELGISFECVKSTASSARRRIMESEMARQHQEQERKRQEREQREATLREELTDFPMKTS